MRTAGISGTAAFTEGVFSGPFFGQFCALNTNASTGAITGTAGDITGGSADVVLFLTGAQSGGVNYTLASVASIVASYSQPFAQQDIVGWQYRLRIINNGTTQTITVVGGIGWTLGGGTYTLANNSYRDFVVQFTSPTAATLTEVGSGTYP